MGIFSLSFFWGRGFFQGFDVYSLWIIRIPVRKSPRVSRNLTFVFIGLNFDICLLGFSCKNWRLQFGLFNIKMKYIINSHCFWLELCQLYKLMLKILCYSDALIENSALDTATRTLTDHPFHLISNVAQLKAFLSQIICFRRQCLPHFGLLVRCFTIFIKMPLPSMQASDQYIEN